MPAKIAAIKPRRSSGRPAHSAQPRRRPLPAAQASAVRFGLWRCSLGSMLLAQSPRGVCALMIGDDPAFLANECRRRFPGAQSAANDAEFDRVLSAAVTAIEAAGSRWMLPLDLRGTPFQQRVWRALAAIPAGSTASYTEIAARIGAPRAVRAVAQACAANPVAIAVPCHRVVRRDGALSGYRWGIDRKRELLTRERGLSGASRG